MRAHLPGRNFVTRAVQNAEFTAPAHLGDMLEFNFGIASVGRTSVHVRVEMVIYAQHTGEAKKSFDGTVVMVSVDESGRPSPVKT